MPRQIPDIAARLELSRRTIDGWERMGIPGGRPEDTLRMIREELALLEALIADDPATEPAVRELQRRYGDMANKVRLSGN